MPFDFNEATRVMNVNTGNLGGDPRAVAKLSSGLRKCQNFGKAWDVGDQATVFYPFRWWPAEDGTGGSFEMHMSAYYGHQVSDMKALGTTFLRSMSIIDQYGQIVGDGDLAYQFSRVAPLLVSAQKESELAQLNKKDWSVLPQSSYNDARDKIIAKYDSKTNIQAIRPLIGRLTILKVTEVVYVAMDSASGTPVFEDPRKQRTGTYIQTLSDQRLDKLRALANDHSHGILAQNPGLVPESGELYFLEALYNFTSSNNTKSEAGRADPQGVSHQLTLTMKNEAYAPRLKELLNRVPPLPEQIAAHTYGMSPMPDDVLKAKLQAIMLGSTEHLTFLQEVEKDRLVKSAQLFDYLRIAPREDPALVERMEAALGHRIGESTRQDAPTIESIMTPEGVPDYTKQGLQFEGVSMELGAEEQSLDSLL